jgi:hypothetical protein
MPFVTWKMPKWYLVFYRGFYSIFGVAVSVTATILGFSSSREVTGLVNNALNVFRQEEIKQCNIGGVQRPWNCSITPNPVPRNNLHFLGLEVKAVRNNAQNIHLWCN